MSRIGKQPIIIPEQVKIKFDNNLVVVSGPKGELKQEISSKINLLIEDNKLQVSIKKQENSKDAFALWGLYRALISNMVKGVTDGWTKQLEVQGVGYKVVLQGNKLVLSLGLSHTIDVNPPAGIIFNIEKNIITISGIDKQLVGQTAAKIRDYKKPEPYKGKGIRYVGEIVRRKAGKKAVGAE